MAKDEAREIGKSWIMSSSGQPGNGGKQDSDLVMFVSSVELIGRCMKGEFERDKPRTQENQFL